MIKFFCNVCEKEIWPKIMSAEFFKEFRGYTLEEVEENCICEECLALKDKEKK